MNQPKSDSKLQVIGAGLGRTGTMSLKQALERLLGAPCYHMAEVIAKPAHIPLWDAAFRGEPLDQATVFDGYAATVDWPSVTLWEQLSADHPDALILMSHRDAESWWQSAHETIFVITQRMQGPWREMAERMFGAFTPDINDRDSCIAAFHRHYDHVRGTAPRDRLLEWRPGDGWEPICSALGLKMPEEPFPRTNTREEYAAMLAHLPENPQI